MKEIDSTATSLLMCAWRKATSTGGQELQFSTSAEVQTAGYQPLNWQ